MNLQLHQFDINSLKVAATVLIIGKCGSGKTFLTKDILYHHPDKTIGSVISPSEPYTGFYSKFLSPYRIHYKFNENIVKDIVKDVVQLHKDNIECNACLILDDCIVDYLRESDIIRKIILNSRYLRILSIITVQYPCIGVGPRTRSSIDYIFILRENIISNRKKIYYKYAGMFPTFEVFCCVLDACTVNYGCLVIDNTRQSNRLEDIVSYYHASDHPGFTYPMKQQKEWRPWNHSKHPSRFRKQIRTVLLLAKVQM